MSEERLPLQLIFASLGIWTQDRGHYLLFRSPWRADNKPSCVAYKSTGYVVDFGGTFKGSVERFVYELTGTAFNKQFPDLSEGALSWSGHGGSFLQQTAMNERTKNRVPMIIEGEMIQVFSDMEAYRYCQARHITDALIERLEITYLKSGTVNGGWWKNRLMIPIRVGGLLRSIEGRDVTKLQDKKVLYPKGGDVSSLFNLDELRTDTPLVVVEGLMDWFSVKRVYENSTCTFGIQLSAEQKRELKRFDLILLSDSDEGGETMVDIVDSFFEKEFKVARVPEKDPGESTPEHIAEAIASAKPVTQYLLWVTGELKKERLLW